MGGGSSKVGGLEKNDIEKVKESWKIVMLNAEDNAVFIFKTFLDKHNYYSKFSKFSNIPLDQLTDNKIFRKHALSIVQALNNIIGHLENESIIRSDLIALGKFHGRKSVTEDEFQELKKVILDTLKQQFNLSADTLAAWTKTLDSAYIYVFEGLRKT